MGSSDDERELKKKEKKDKGKDKDEKKDKKDKHKDEKDKDKHKDEKGKDKHKDEKDKDKKDKDKHKDEKDKHKDEKDKHKDKHKDEKDKHKDEKDKGKDKHKDKKDKKDKKDEKDKDKDKKDKPSHPSGPVQGGEAASYYGSSSAPPQPHSQPAHPSQPGEAHWFLREPGPEPIPGQQPPQPSFPNPNTSYTSQPPPLNQPVQAGGAKSAQSTPPSGYRLPLDPNAPFPGVDQLGQPPAVDFDGLTPVYIGSAIFPNSVQPCRIIPTPHPVCRVLYGSSEVDHHGRYDLLPITPDMEWVQASHGEIPPGRRPVDGGYESNGAKLYHSLGYIQGIYVPGKAGEHLVSISRPCALEKELTIIEISSEAQISHSGALSITSKKTIVSCE